MEKTIRTNANDILQGDAHPYRGDILIRMDDTSFTILNRNSEIMMSRQEAEELRDMITKWISGDPGREWSDYWTLALK